MRAKHSRPEAYIAVANNRQKIYPGRKVYLNGGTEFQLELFNPMTETVAAEIHINGESISDSVIVIKPGQRYFLDRFIEDNSKFKFDTYTVEDSEEAKDAIANNGVVRVKFYKEQARKSYNPIINWGPMWNAPDPNPYPGWNVPYCGTGGWAGTTTTGQSGPDGELVGKLYSSEMNMVSDEGSLGVSANFCCTDNLNEVSLNASLGDVETGRVENGSRSSQTFDYYDGKFESFSFASEEYLILPASAQPVEVEQIRKYCTGCGNRVRKSSWKFCPSCGEQL